VISPQDQPDWARLFRIACGLIQPKTTDSTIERVIEGEKILPETVPEIITKKIVHRGSSIKPRDIFDIAAAGEQYGLILMSGSGQKRFVA
jgi:hypothetical protein